jgi:hypothetical protein
MMLGALPTRSSAAAAVQNVQSSPQKLQTFAMQTGQTYDASKPIVPLITPQGDDDDDGGSDIVETLKKYAPYIIAGGIILYLILRNKK